MRDAEREVVVPVEVYARFLISGEVRPDRKRALLEELVGLVRAQAFEEAAKIVEAVYMDPSVPPDIPADELVERIAAAIRAAATPAPSTPREEVRDG